MEKKTIYAVMETIMNAQKVADELDKQLEKDKKFRRVENTYVPTKYERDEIVKKFLGYANLLYEGSGYYKQDFKQAYEIYKYLADENECEALYFIALYYQEGYKPVDKDIVKAISYYKKAIKAVGIKATYATASANNLGVIYATSNDIEKDLKKAFNYYKKAANHNDAYAYASLAKFYEKGEVVERDQSKALSYYEKARDLALFDDTISWNFKDELEKDIKKLKAKVI